MSEPYLVLVVFIFVTLATIKYYGHLLIASAFVFYSPLFLVLKVYELVLKSLSKRNLRLLKQGRFTIWLKIHSRVLIRFYSLQEDLLHSFLSFTLGEQQMAIIIKRVGEETKYVPVAQRDLPKEEQAVLIFKKLPRKTLVTERDNMVGLSSQGRVEALRSSSVAYHITVKQLCGWSGVVDENGNAVPFDPANKEGMYELLPTSLQEELEAEFGGGSGQKSEAEDEEAQAEA